MKIFSKGKSTDARDGVATQAPPAAPRKMERPLRAGRPEGVPAPRPPRESERDLARNEASALVDWFSAGSIREIDSLIGALQSLLADLQVEHRRVVRELSDFARVSDAALETTTVLTETLGRWRGAPPRGR
jgi:hypothetical protein